MKSIWKPILPPFAHFKKSNLVKQVRVSSFIYQIGEYPALRQPSMPIDINKLSTQEYKTKIRYMRFCLKKYRKITGKGRAIAAVQVGLPEEMIVVYDPELKNESFMMINPKIMKQSKEMLKYPEMCMSAAPVIAEVVRPAWIEVEYFDENGKKQVWNTKADTDKGKIFNRVIQHEIDHLLGVICIDKVFSKNIILESNPDFYKNASFKKV